MKPAYSKLAAVGMLLLLLLGAWMLLAEPYIDLWQDRVTQAERQQRKQNALRTLIDQREHFEQQFEALSESEALRAVFLDDRPGALADAKLQRIVREVVEQAGGRVLQVAIAKARAAKRSSSSGETTVDKKVTVSVMMQGSIESIYNMLYELENGRPLVLVSNFEITHIESRYPVEQSVSDTSYRAKYDATAFIL
ncbi:MAG: type II secretion system protein GspM [Gammaproteobacteria bacterium]|nr:type II secretion system protein GspM [Gammaproteobacteria bacterium]